MPYDHQRGRAGGQSPSATGDGSDAPAAARPGAGKRPAALNELQQTSCSLTNTWFLCAQRSPLCHAATDPNYFETAASDVMFIPNHPHYAF